VTAVLARIAVRAIKLYSASTEGTLPSSTLFVHFTRTVIFLIGILVILNALNVSITPMLTALGVGGIAIALALQDTLSNFFAGVHVLASRQIKPKDYIKLDSGEEGYILDITWRNTIIKNLPNNIIIVPNSKLSTAIITNYNLLENFIKVYIGIGVSYDSDLEQVEKVTLEVANEIMREIPGGVPHYEPAIRYHTFADFSINLNVVLLAQEFASQYLIKHEFIKRLHKRYNQEGIVIPYPIRTIYSQGMIHESPQ